ncbi:isopenicillin N synthase family dioxygenase [Paracraurococcus lichenis]|uniref:2-oxoglutarate-dependent ethylene/succinate-forming enzyme n=1 Tax=Paracraurococcus lichenis TaxID=3064888 RepID=A0ABT9E2V2_9PROT|nr:2OG-Fe(II) oxygenase family protein [Paracraurococcus sp. LOR1-02]MDO9710488.1 2-oxoglutarate and iron-dependent oxygenase domain-containing protein [Paracraurococcus sp. LOR1-02]
MAADTAAAPAIPIIDLGPYLAGEPGALEATAAQLRHVNETIGFMTIVNHGVPAALVEEAFAACARFHAQPLEAKLAVKANAQLQGYVPLRGSTTRHSKINPDNKPNENEAFFMKRDGEDAGAPDRWPADLPGFREVALRYYDAMDALAQRLLPLYAVALDMPPGHFGPFCDRPLSGLRFTHYPPAEYGANQFGIAPHSDSSFITLLAQNKVPGLQLRTTAGEWIDMPVIPDSFVVNTGEVLHRWSNGRFINTPHRAYNVSAGPRYAIPYFFHPNPDTLIEALPTCRVPGEAPRFEPMTVGDYMAWFRNQNYDHVRKQDAA